MKHYIGNILAVALLSTLCLHAEAQESYLGIVDTSSCKIRIVAGPTRYAELSMNLNVEEMSEIAPQYSSYILPVLQAANRTQTYEFSPIYIDGHIRAKAIDRMSVLSGTKRPEGSIVIRPDTEKETTLHYSARIPYSPDMLGARIVLRETVTGCAGCTEHEAVLNTDKGIDRYEPQWKFTATPASGDKIRHISARADLKFEINKHDIIPGLAGNAETLDKVISSVSTASNSSIYTITGINFTGYASPDGPEGFNRTLALNRAHSLAEYVMSQAPGIPDGKVSVESIGEDWDGLFKAVDNDIRISGNTTIARIKTMLGNDNWSECERILKQDTELYDYLRGNILPSLRRTEYTIEYVIRDFEASEAAQLWKERPELLSVDEFKAAADLYGKDSPEYLEVLLAAARTYPDDPAALQTAALALRTAGKGQNAINLLEGHDNPLLLNTLGVLYAEVKAYEKAKQTLEAAAAAGNMEAEKNMEELEIIRLQLEY